MFKTNRFSLKLQTWLVLLLLSFDASLKVFLFCIPYRSSSSKFSNRYLISNLNRTLFLSEPDIYSVDPQVILRFMQTELID